jgi:hypothetical protein
MIAFALQFARWRLKAGSVRLAHRKPCFDTPMKTSLRTIGMIAAFGFALASLLQFTGLVTIPGVPPAILVGGFVFSCSLVLVLGDYSRKPAFRVRRTSADSNHEGYTVNRPAGQGPDWTYTTRNK